MSSSKISELSSVFGFKVDVSQTLRHLNSDFFDEWYYDCLHYKDLLEAKPHVATEITELINTGLGRYPPASRIVRNVPKKGLPIRYSLETDFYDRFVYQAICSFLVRFFDPVISHRVLSHRAAKSNGRYLFRNRIERWLTYEGVTLTFKRGKQFLLVTDLANYFENIRNKDILEALNELLPEVSATALEKQQIRNAIELLAICLDQWSFIDGFGLSQNRDPSHFLANLVLANVDRAMAGLNYDYYRYVDDIRIVCNTENDAKKALVDLIEQLRQKGFNVNSAKTEILSHDGPDDVLEAYFPNRDPRVVAIEQMWKSRSKAIILKSIKYLVALLTDCIEAQQTQSRAFRFAANRLAQLSDLGVLKSEHLGPELPSILVTGMLEQPASTDQYCKILNLFGLEREVRDQIETFLLDRNRAIHDWQNYHLWMLLAKKTVKSEALRKAAIELLKSSMQTAEAGAILVWADQAGYKSVVNCALAQFEENLPFQLQRYLAIAIRNYPSSKLAAVYPKVSRRISGTSDRSKHFENQAGKIVFPTRTVAINNLFDEMTEYD